MCGICGIQSREPRALAGIIKRMNDAQAHRGPDGEGYCVASESLVACQEMSSRIQKPANCAMAHRRLMIIDPEGGAQPMVSGTGACAVVLNGEIYNFLEIRKRLEGQGARFLTNSDTEVLLHLYERYPDDPPRWLAMLDGIFALALWDQRRRQLLLARDRFGVKPLHYFCNDVTFAFASEIKSLLEAGIHSRLNLNALHLFMNIRYVPDEQTLFKDIYRFPPAHYALVKDGSIQTISRFYELPRKEGLVVPSADLPRAVRETFFAAVERQMLSDVPIGIPLSGGLDSSMIVAASVSAYREGRIRRTADTITRTFTLGFNEPSDENDDAYLVADHFGSEHHDTKLASAPLEGMSEGIRAVEEPKINIIQGYALAGFVKPFVKVLLGGLGGDELFAGYTIHRFCNTLGKLHSMIPGFLQQAALAPISSLMWKIQNASTLRQHDLLRLGAQIALSSGDRVQFYTRLRNAWDFDGGMYDMLYARPEIFRQCPPTAEYFTGFFKDKRPYLDQVLWAEFNTKMVNDFLLNEDRVMSAHGIEGRVPFLDRELVELAFSIPAARKMRGTETKYLWKKSIRDDLPAAVLRKKKQGFSFSSYHQWQKDLRNAVEKELTRDWCSETGLFNYRFIQELLEHKPHPNLRWHYFTVWMMLGVKEWMRIFGVESEA